MHLGVAGGYTTVVAFAACCLFFGGMVTSCGVVLGTDQEPIALDGYAPRSSSAGDVLESGSQDTQEGLPETVVVEPTGKDAEDGPRAEFPEVVVDPAQEFNFFLANVEIVVSDHPPVAEFRDSEGRVIVRTLPGIVSLLKLNESHLWDGGLAAVDILSEVEQSVADGYAEVSLTATGVSVMLFDAAGAERIEMLMSPATDNSHIVISVRPVGLSLQGAPTHVRLAMECVATASFHGMGGQSSGSDLRGRVVDVRASSPGLGKDDLLPLSETSVYGHATDSSFPLPYVMISQAEPFPMAHGWVLNSDARSRFDLCSSNTGIMDMQVALTETDDAMEGETANLVLLPGPAPKDVVRVFTGIYGRAHALPRWVFGPWVSFLGGPTATANGAQALITSDVPAGAAVLEEFFDYAHPDIVDGVNIVQALGLRVLTYYSPMLNAGYFPDFAYPIEKDWVARFSDGTPYIFEQADGVATGLVDLTMDDAWDWLRGKLAYGYGRGVDGWFANHGDVVAPDMQFWDGRTGLGYANRYPVDWAEINDIALETHHKTPDEGVFVMRSGYLGSLPYQRVVWLGRQRTDFSPLDGLASIIPHATNLGLSGVSAVGHDIGGHTGYVAPVRDRELHYRWTQLSAYSPVMATHRGELHLQNWPWNGDVDSVDHFRSYALMHMRLIIYQEALHMEAMSDGVPAMRHLLLEFPEWPQAQQEETLFMLGPAILVAPVLEKGEVSREVFFPPGGWYDMRDGAMYDSSTPETVSAPLNSIPVFLRAGGILPLLDDRVRCIQQTVIAPGRPSVGQIAAERLELHVGVGAPGYLLLEDGTEILFEAAPEPTAPVPTDADAWYGDGMAIAPCGASDHPLTVPCYGTDMQGRRVSAASYGEGTVFFGSAVTGGETYRLEIIDGMPGRQYHIFIYRGMVDGM